MRRLASKHVAPERIEAALDALAEALAPEDAGILPDDDSEHDAAIERWLAAWARDNARASTPTCTADEERKTREVVAAFKGAFQKALNADDEEGT